MNNKFQKLQFEVIICRNNHKTIPVKDKKSGKSPVYTAFYLQGKTLQNKPSLMGVCIVLECQISLLPH
jgi:hypothetical protein